MVYIAVWFASVIPTANGQHRIHLEEKIESNDNKFFKNIPH